MAQLEIACFNLDSVRISQENGADRVELCDQMEVGGTTPTIDVVQKARAILNIDLYVMIRPRGGNFIYSDEEFAQMKSDILAAKECDVDGFVFGILNKDNSINNAQNSELVELAKPFLCTFHRAFDEVSDAFQSLEDLIACGFKTILTSGQKENAVQGVERLSELVKKADNRIIIMPGGGLRSTNIKQIQQQTQAVFYHSSAIIDGSQTASAQEIQDLKLNLK